MCNLSNTDNVTYTRDRASVISHIFNDLLSLMTDNVTFTRDRVCVISRMFND